MQITPEVLLVADNHFRDCLVLGKIGPLFNVEYQEDHGGPVTCSSKYFDNQREAVEYFESRVVSLGFSITFDRLN
jgi:hypothetical protein